MGLNFLISERRRRRSRLRWARSAASVWARCSRIWRGDQRCLVARARKSSTSAATACRPICSSCAGRLLLGVVVVRVGELIVSLQIVGADIQRLRLRMAAEIQRRQGRSAMMATQQEGDRGGARRIPLQALPGWRGAKRLRRTDPANGAVERFDWRPILPGRRRAPASPRFPERPAPGGLRALLGGPYVWCAARLVHAPGPGWIAAGHRSDDGGRSRRRHPGCAHRCRRPPGSKAGPRLRAGWNSR